MKKECCIKTIKQIEEFLKDKTLKKEDFPSRVVFLAFEWAEFKTKLIGEKE